MRINDGGPAFARPASEYTDQGTLANGNRAEEAQSGLSLLDYMAGQAITGILSATYGYGDGDEYEVMVRRAYDIAAAMLAERQRRQS